MDGWCIELGGWDGMGGEGWAEVGYTLGLA